MRTRLLVVVIGCFASIFLLFVRLIDIQIVRGESFWNLAERNRWFELPLVPNRGVLLDRFGDPLVLNQRYYTELEYPDQLYSSARLIEPSEALHMVATDSARVRTHARRFYPYSYALAPVTGYVAAITQEDITKDRSLQPFGIIGKSGLERAFERQLRGQLGVERYEIDARVRRQKQIIVSPAVDGVDIGTTVDPYLSEVAYRALGDQRGVVLISEVSTGNILSLVSKPTYNPSVFSDLHQLFEQDTRKIASAQIQSWMTDEHQPFFNRAVSGQYPPGSTFKLVTALAGLETQAITTRTTVLDEGVLKVGDFQYANWFWTQYGRTEGEIGLIRSLARSNDIFFYKAAEWIGPTKLAEWSRLFGLGTPVGIEIAGEKSGLVPDPAWKQAVVGEPWYLGNTYHYGIGQGDVKTTPLQLLQLTQAFGNQGTMCAPHLVHKDHNVCQELGVTQTSLDAVMHGMLDACAPGGTSFPFFSKNGTALANLSVARGVDLKGSFTAFGVEEALSVGAVACKTGTAEFGGQDSRGFRNTHGLWVGVLEPRLADHKTSIDSTILGDVVTSDAANSDIWNSDITQVSEVSLAELYAIWMKRRERSAYPKRLAIVVIVESDEKTPYKEGSRDAAPVASKIVDWLEGKIEHAE